MVLNVTKKNPYKYINITRSILCLCVADSLLGLGLPRLDAQFPDVELAAAPPVGPADECILLPAHLHDHQVSDVDVGGDEEG